MSFIDINQLTEGLKILILIDRVSRQKFYPTLKVCISFQ